MAFKNAINKFYGRPDRSIGGFRGEYPVMHAVSLKAEKVSEAFPHNLYRGAQVPETYKLDRLILVNQPDARVTFVLAGFLNNQELR